LHAGRLRLGGAPLTLALQLIEGPIRIDVDGPALAPALGFGNGRPVVRMTQRRLVFGMLRDPAVVAPLFGLTPDDVTPGARVQTVSTGPP